MTYYVQWNDVTRDLGIDYDQIALFRSSEYVNIFGMSMPRKGNKEIEGLLKISYKNKTIYRKYIGSNIPDEADDIILNYRSLAELGINPKNIPENQYQLLVAPASAWAYLWNNSYAYIRKPFRCAIYGLLISIGFGIASLVFDILSLCL